MPAAVEWVEGWGIGKPDAVYQLPVAYDVPASGVIDYQHVIVPTGFTEDKWIQAAEVRPTARSVVHHIIAYVREPGSNWFHGQKPGVFFIARRSKPKKNRIPARFLAISWSVTRPANLLKSCGRAKPSSSKRALTSFSSPLHAARTRYARSIRLGIIFAKEPPRERVLTLSATNGTFKIPPGHPNYRVDSSFEVATDVKLSGLHPHMHGRGKDFEYRLVFPGGESRTILSVPHYDWHWQNCTTSKKPSLYPRAPASIAQRTSIILPTIPKTPTQRRK